MHVLSVTLSVESKALKYVISTEGLTKFDHDLVADIYGGFLRTLSDASTDGPTALLNEKKEKLLYNVLFTNPDDGKLIYNSNPDIEMVHDAFLLGVAVPDDDGKIARAKMPYMTMRTWSSVYEPLYTDALAKVIADGICPPQCDVEYFIKKDVDTERGMTTVSKPGFQSLDERHGCEILCLEMKKLYCRRMVSEGDLWHTSYFRGVSKL